MAKQQYPMVMEEGGLYVCSVCDLGGLLHRKFSCYFGLICVRVDPH